MSEPEKPKHKLWQFRLSTAIIMSFIIPVIARRLIPLVTLLYKNEPLPLQVIAAIAVTAWLLIMVLIFILVERLTGDKAEKTEFHSCALFLLTIVVLFSLLSPSYLLDVLALVSVAMLGLLRLLVRDTFPKSGVK